jgi:presenilin-like A22 family membrane protease
MKLYEIYQYIVLGTLIGSFIGLAVAWYFFLSDRDKER